MTKPDIESIKKKLIGLRATIGAIEDTLSDDALGYIDAETLESYCDDIDECRARMRTILLEWLI